MLDADEILSETLSEEIRSGSYENGGFRIYDIPRKNYFLWKWIRGTWPDPQRRLFRKEKAFRYSSDVHETIATDEPVGRLAWHFEHLTEGYWVAEWVRKMNSYTDKAVWNGEKMGVFKLFGRPFVHAAYYYFAKGGFRDGLVGIAYWAMVWTYSFIENMKKYEKSIESVASEKH